ncbi:M23 family metallopeptidase [Anaerofustis butyriciformans]|uniref:M23 family metallopeptidase n=1 Tax=Anaerofustis butyriciformans TaxID=3108533 RepID=UPI002E309D1D|nr:M23 family metallopeptidase [Anaerofustis sp. HA2171]
MKRKLSIKRKFYKKVLYFILNLFFTFIILYPVLNDIDTIFYLFNKNYIISKNEAKLIEYKAEKSDFIKPVEGVITSEFSYRVHPITGKKTKHNGIDIGAKWHDDIKATADGEVVEVGCDKEGYGNYIKIKHEYDIYSFYAHLSKISVKKGQKVKQGDVIGKEGGDPEKDKNPGSSTGHHLHFEIRTSSDVKDCINPLIFVDYE